MTFKLKHQTHLETGLKFVLLCGILALYFFYLVKMHGISKGSVTLALTWSFFVLCTPIADAGFLLDFPVRLLFGFRMFIVEIFVWVLAITISTASLFLAPEYFKSTLITRVFHQILCNPIPYWSIICLAFIGTFASIYFGDEMIDVITHNKRVKHHKHGFKYRTLILISVPILVITIYYQLITELGISSTIETIF